MADKEYIDRGALLRDIHRNPAEDNGERCAQILEAILNAPTADVVEVVRCKDCVYYKPYAKPVEDFDGRCTARRGETDDDEFCNRGNRRKQT